MKIRIIALVMAGVLMLAAGVLAEEPFTWDTFSSLMELDLKADPLITVTVEPDCPAGEFPLYTAVDDTGEKVSFYLVLEEEAERESDTPGYYYGQIGENPIALQAVPNGFLLHYGQAGEVKTIELAMDGTEEEQESKLINITFSEAVETVMDYLFGSEEDDPE